ncbi:MAG: hypothetical protein GYB67_15790 [Chloroflexi bacterium]|nr:hypothetical protein [Chloroflexota bacterium]
MPNLTLDYALSPQFLIATGLVLAGFLPIVWSLWRTWQDNRHKERTLIAEQRAARRQRRRRLPANTTQDTPNATQ